MAILFEDVISENLESLEIEKSLEDETDSFVEFSEELDDVYVEVGEDIREKLLSRLDDVLNHDIPEFNNDVARALATPALDAISDPINNAATGIFGNNQFGSFVGNTASNAAGGFITNAVNNGLNRFFGPITRVSSRETSRSRDAVSQMRLSRSQQAALILQELNRGKRNL